MDRVVFGTGTVIARIAHAKLHAGLPFEVCLRCRPAIWEPGASFGVLVADGPRLVTGSALATRLLVR